MERLIISAPFGNYESWFGDWKATLTVGTFTLNRRAGFIKRWWRIFSTVRYYHSIRAWRNKLGLPNPGIDYFLDKVLHKKIDISKKIISVTADTNDGWFKLYQLMQMYQPMAVELNISCPNVAQSVLDYEEVFGQFTSHFKPLVIVKLPPVKYSRLLDLCISKNIPAIHCCNTLPMGEGLGGLSGKPLKAFSLNVIDHARKNGYKGKIIGGGGITCQKDVDDYVKAGADHFAVASTLFNPFSWKTIRNLQWPSE